MIERMIVKGSIARGGVFINCEDEDDSLFVKMGNSINRHRMEDDLYAMKVLRNDFYDWAEEKTSKIVDRIHKNGFSEDIKLEIEDLYEDVSCFEKILQAYNDAWTAQCIYWEDKIDCRIVRLEAA